ncbi:MAG: 2-phosphosulfolactate phosphatase [Flavobacteriales bacterium]
MKNKIQTCFSPAVYHLFQQPDNIVVVVDILRATSAIVTAFAHGVKSMIPVATVEEARAYQQKGFLAAAERNAVKIEGFDFGNSPLSYQNSEQIKGQTIAISTTNGTQAIEAAKGTATIVVGAFLNITSLSQWIIKQNKDVIILCAGWKNKFNLEDTLFAGALTKKLIESKMFETECDATIAAEYLIERAGDNLYDFLEYSSHRKRLKNLHLESDIEFCLQYDTYPIIPIFNGEVLVCMPDDFSMAEVASAIAEDKHP